MNLPRQCPSHSQVTEDVGVGLVVVRVLVGLRMVVGRRMFVGLRGVVEGMAGISAQRLARQMRSSSQSFLVLHVAP